MEKEADVSRITNQTGWFIEFHVHRVLSVIKKMSLNQLAGKEEMEKEIRMIRTAAGLN